MEEKNEEKFFVLKITALEWWRTNSQNLQEDTCHWQSMCYKTTLRFKTSLSEIFS